MNAGCIQTSKVWNHVDFSMITKKCYMRPICQVIQLYVIIEDKLRFYLVKAKLAYIQGLFIHWHSIFGCQ